MKEVGIRELRDHLSQYLKEVREGENLTVTDRGKPVARIIPTRDEMTDRVIGPLLEDGRARWAGGKPDGCRVEPREGPELSEYVVEDRR